MRPHFCKTSIAILLDFLASLPKGFEQHSIISRSATMYSDNSILLLVFNVTLLLVNSFVQFFKCASKFVCGLHYVIDVVI